MIKTFLKSATDAIATKLKKSPLEDATQPYQAGEPASPQRAAAAPQTLQVASKLDLIVVPQSAMDIFPSDPEPLVRTVVDYVSYLLHTAQFRRDELPIEAMQAFHCAGYLKQVMNGGHAQFVDNCGDDLTQTISDIMGGLIGMKAEPYKRIAGQMATWVALHSDDARTQLTENDERARKLAGLDAPFLAQDKKHPFATCLAGWIAQLEILQAVPDDMLHRVYAGIAKTNGKSRPLLLTAPIAKHAEHDDESAAA